MKNQSIQTDPVITKLPDKVPAEMRGSFSDDQLVALKVALEVWASWVEPSWSTALVRKSAWSAGRFFCRIWPRRSGSVRHLVAPQCVVVDIIGL